MLCALIMAGGRGTRFWPLSTEEKPKQFLNLLGNDTMLQMTVNRIKPIIPIERIFVCTIKRYENIVKEQLPELSHKNIIIEPEGRNTAPAITLSAFIIEKYFKDSSMIVLPADHLIKEEEKFRRMILKADSFIEENPESIITLGITPDRPETGYGYIKCNMKCDLKELNVLKVDSFVEKPDKKSAQKYLSDGRYLWNSGMFIWKSSKILNEIKKYSFNTYNALSEIENVDEEEMQVLVDRKYGETEAISIDYAVLEKSEDIFVIYGEIGWDDIGTWKAIERYKDKDKDDNIIQGDIRVIESESNIVLNNNKKLVLIGIKNVMTMETDDSIYIVDKKYMDTLGEFKNII